MPAQQLRVAVLLALAKWPNQDGGQVDLMGVARRFHLPFLLALGEKVQGLGQSLSY